MRCGRCGWRSTRWEWSSDADAAGRSPSIRRRPTDRPVAAEHPRFAFDDAAYVWAPWTSPVAARSNSIWTVPGVPGGGRRDQRPAGRSSRASDATTGPPTRCPTRCCRGCCTGSGGRRRRQWRTASAGVAACVVAALVLGGGPVAPSHQPVVHTMQATSAGHGHPRHDHPDRFSRGPRLELICGYTATGAPYAGPKRPAYGCVYNRRDDAARPGRWSPLPGEDVEIERTSPWPAKASAGSRSPMTPASRCCGRSVGGPAAARPGCVTPGGPRRPGCRGSCVPGSRSRRCRSPTAAPAAGSARTPPGWGTPPSDRTARRPRRT